MGGFLFNGCGAKDYFTKVKPLGSFKCPNCKKVAQFYLEKGNLKVAVLWIPTVSIKERYAIMCEKCEQGKWIDDETAYKIMNGAKFDLDSGVEAEKTEKTEKIKPAAVSSAKCPKCGSEVEGDFCGMCGTRYATVIDKPVIPEEKPAQKAEVKVEAKAEVKAAANEWECYLCGTINPKDASKCSLCGCEKDGI